MDKHIITNSMSQPLTRDDCTIMRGIAICFVLFHNFFLHVYDIPKGCEFYFDPTGNDMLAHLINTTRLRAVIGFFTHYSTFVDMSAFTFLSGYGLVIKYERGAAPMPAFMPFVRHHYRKLASMMAAGLAMYFIYLCFAPDRSLVEFVPRILPDLTLLANFCPRPESAILPFIYWFLGMIFQLYAIYRLAIWRRPTTVLLVLVVAALLLQAIYLSPDDTTTLLYLRATAIGWLLPFALGILYARHPIRLHTGISSTDVAAHDSLRSKLIYIGVFIISSILILLSSHSPTLWLIIPIFACAHIVAVIHLLPTILRAIFRPIGILSATLYVIHPTLRDIFICYFEHTPYLLTHFAYFLLSTFTLALAWHHRPQLSFRWDCDAGRSDSAQNTTYLRHIFTFTARQTNPWESAWLRRRR